MYSKILVPLDGSPTAEKTLPYARLFARRLNLPVELLTVFDVTDIPSRLSAEDYANVLDLVESDMRRSETYLNRVAATFRETNVACSVDKGVAESGIIQRASADKNTLIQMATHGRSGLQRWLLGSVAEKVLRGTANSLLLVRATEDAKSEGEARLKTVIVPLDGSELAEKALMPAAELSRKLDLGVLLYRAYNIPSTAYVPVEGYQPVDRELIAAARNDATEYLERKTEGLKASGVQNVSWVCDEGPAADGIIALAGKTPESLIAMSTHGRSGVTRWVLGSVTETVVRHTGEPILVIRAD